MKKILTLIFLSLVFSSCKDNSIVYPPSNTYPVHRNITSTYFWVGEPSDSASGYIPNSQSSWDINWQAHYGGVDDPNNRSGYFPAGFTPKENPFYFALPYNDFDVNGNRRQSVYSMIYWANSKTWSAYESMCKNQWIKITKNNKSVYAQWEDCGPFFCDDSNYVFGSSLPRNQYINNSSGLDVSPAVKDYLGLTGLDTVSWQFVNPENVPIGPWKLIVTTSQIDWGQ